MKHYSTMKQSQPRWIMSLKDLCPAREPARYVIDNENEIVLSKRWREMLETIRLGPVFCASPVRLSDAVCVLRREYGVMIDTLPTNDGRKFYQLASNVQEAV